MYECAGSVMNSVFGSTARCFNDFGIVFRLKYIWPIRIRDRNLKTHLSSRPLTLICFESRLSAVTVQTSLREYDELMLILVFFGRKFINKSPIFPGRSLKTALSRVIFHYRLRRFLRRSFRIDRSILMNCIILIIFQF